MAQSKEQIEKRNQIVALLYQQLNRSEADELLLLIDDCLSFQPPVSGSLPPSEQEIVDKANEIGGTIYQRKLFKEGAEWMRDLLKGNDR